MANSYVQLELIRNNKLFAWENDEVTAKLEFCHHLNAKSIYVYSTTIPIAEQLYVGLYCSDCACQTEHDEIVQLKSTTKLLKNLYQV